MSEKELQDFISRNAYEIPAEELQRPQVRCVDGRYIAAEGKTLPALAVPGADAGYALVALAALNDSRITFSHESIWDAILETVGGEGTIQFHTDIHAEGKGAGRGCGHLRKAAESPADYGLLPEDMDFIFEKLDDIAFRYPQSQIMLHGQHMESAVIVVESERYSLNPREYPDTADERQVFVFQKTLHEKQLRTLVRNLLTYHQISVQIDENQLLPLLEQSFDRQLQTTLHRLAKGKPIYIASFHDETGEVEVTSAGVVE